MSPSHSKIGPVARLRFVGWGFSFRVPWLRFLQPRLTKRNPRGKRKTEKLDSRFRGNDKKRNRRRKEKTKKHGQDAHATHGRDVHATALDKMVGNGRPYLLDPRIREDDKRKKQNGFPRARE